MLDDCLGGAALFVFGTLTAPVLSFPTKPPGACAARLIHIEHPTGEEMNEWQPIETAPRDGMEILLFARGQHNDVYRGVGQWSEQSKD